MVTAAILSCLILIIVFPLKNLANYNKLPKAEGPSLNLRSLRINDVARLSGISYITPLIFLDLSNNKLTKLEPGIFDNLSDLVIIYLSNNKLSNLEPGIFKGIKNLRHLMLYNNKFDATEARSST